jgi:glucose/arabinose dehydrogenase
VHITHAGDGSGRLFIVEQNGRIQIIKNGQLFGTFLDINARVRSPSDLGGGDEEGLLSIAFPPGYGVVKDYFYVYYTNLNGNNQVSRFHLGASADLANPNSEVLILQFNHPNENNHNGGQIAFGPDGYLYIGTGDGGGSGDPSNNAQNTNSLLGKLLRIDTEMEPAPLPPLDHQLVLPLVVQNTGGPLITYRIPLDNPYANTAGYRGEIWAFGLRNPWRFSFDRLQHDLFVADVGQGDWEEIDFQASTSAGGENYGWDILEGFVCFSTPGCNTTGKTVPIHTYDHSVGCSVTGGYVYRGTTYTGMGIYYFGDFCSGNIWGIQRENNSWVVQPLKDTPYWLSSFGEDEAGELYVADRAGGRIYHIQEILP